ncbi:MAG: tRNA threonylcarbamoyl adenosine modification protein (Sua5/YciO/YrdC/YwlC family) [Actinomycetes bacterium]|jgi:tRNA threonylcarbamoyl adenosine modification protein (Sua5/YciO/YrdC/YwlC family)
MVRYFDVHPADPQPRAISQIVDILQRGGIVAYPTDSGYALGWTIGNAGAIGRIKSLRALDDSHHFTLICHDLAQLSEFVELSNPVFRAIKAATPGAYTFILPATKVVPKKLLSPKRRTVGARIPDNAVAQALVAELGEPLMSSTLLLPGEEDSLSEGWIVKERLNGAVDAVVDAGECPASPTTVVDLTGLAAEILRVGAGDVAAFE